MTSYAAHIVVFVGIYSMLAVSLDLMAGRTGMVSAAHAALFGIGAYAAALLESLVGAPFAVGMAGATIIAVCASIPIAIGTRRLRGDSFILATLGLQMVIYGVFQNWNEVTRGPLGISGISQPVILGWTVDTSSEFAILVTACAVTVIVVVWLLVTSPLGRVLHGIREDETFVQACGKRVLLHKSVAFGVSSAIASMSGALYAHYITYIDPTSFTVMESILVLSMVIIGGAGSMWGPLVGAVVLVTLPEALRFIGLPTAVAANLRQIIYGALLVIMMLARPQGLVGRYAFGR